MDAVPFLFIDCVCHRVTDLEKIEDLSGSWWNCGSLHSEKRRHLTFACRVDGEEVACSLWEPESKEQIDCSGDVASQLRLNYDKISDLRFDTADFGVVSHHVSADKLQRAILPTIAPFVANCSWPYFADVDALQTTLFNAFKNCAGFKAISVREQGKESSDFVIRQVELGNLERIHLEDLKPIPWPEPEKLGAALETFARSPRFRGLVVSGPLPNDFELLELCLERALANELQQGTWMILIGLVAFDEIRFGALRPEYRDGSEELAWRVPGSGLRVVFQILPSSPKKVLAALKVCSERNNCWFSW